MPLDSADIRPRTSRQRQVPDGAMIRLPNDDKDLMRVARDTIEVCRDGVGSRLEFYRFLNLISEVGA